MIALAVLAFAAGLAVVLGTLGSAIRTFVLPRSATDPLTMLHFTTMRRLFYLRLKAARTYEARDSILALYAPVSLVILPIVWLTLVLIGYTGIYWALGVRPLVAAFELSGSSLLTLGFANTTGIGVHLLVFTEAAIGLILVALLIAYLPTMYAAFSKREMAVTLLEVRAGDPPSAIEMILRLHRLGRIDRLADIWPLWESWFAELEETHTSLAALVFFRSPQPSHSWITAAGAVLDAAALSATALDIPRVMEAETCLRAGYIALRRVSDFFAVAYDPNPQPGDPILIGRGEFDAELDRLAAAGVPLKPDREQIWRDFGGWRINYDVPLVALAGIIAAPYAPWSSDRGIAPRMGILRRVAAKKRRLSAYPRD